MGLEIDEPAWPLTFLGFPLCVWDLTQAAQSSNPCPLTADSSNSFARGLILRISFRNDSISNPVNAARSSLLSTTALAHCTACGCLDALSAPAATLKMATFISSPKSHAPGPGGNARFSIKTTRNDERSSCDTAV